jgi:hypothetical protein
MLLIVYTADISQIYADEIRYLQEQSISMDDIVNIAITTTQTMIDNSKEFGVAEPDIDTISLLAFDTLDCNLPNVEYVDIPYKAIETIGTIVKIMVLRLYNVLAVVSRETDTWIEGVGFYGWLHHDMVVEVR